MKIVVTIKFVPDLVEELSIDPGGAALDSTWLRLIINEFDDHAIEQAILLKEHGGGTVTIAAADAEGIDDILFASAAKGADQLIKLTGDFGNINNHALALVYADLIKDINPDLILTDYGDTWLFPQLSIWSKETGIELNPNRDKNRQVKTRKADSYFAYEHKNYDTKLGPTQADGMPV